MLLLVRAAFWLILVGVLVRALLPDPVTEPLANQWDKVMHVSAFYVLGLAVAAAYPRHGLLVLGTAMLAFGGLIELLQAIPFLHRDASFGDLLADLLGILLAFLPSALPRLRQGLIRR